MTWIYRPDRYLDLELRTDAQEATWKRLCDWAELPDAHPDELLDDQGRLITGDRLLQWRETACRLRDASAWWFGKRHIMLHYYPGFRQVRLRDKSRRPDIASTFSLLQRVDFELAEGSMGDEWTMPDGSSYWTNGFGGGLIAHGWMCAFRGEEGHRKIASRRWLEWGPWRLIRDEEHDLSLVQFCDVEADDDEVMRQAMPGIDRMGISDDGAVIQNNFAWEYDWQGRYDPARRVFEVPVAGRNLKPFEMLEAAALVYYQSLGPEHPLDRVAFVFAEPERGEAHLHELWLRGLECWVVRDGRRQRLDDAYHPDRSDLSTVVWFPPDAPYPSPGPQPEPWPAWVAEVEARERAAGIFLPSSLPSSPAGSQAGQASGKDEGDTPENQGKGDR